MNRKLELIELNIVFNGEHISGNGISGNGLSGNGFDVNNIEFQKLLEKEISGFNK